MSLFGDFPDDPPARTQKSTLFDSDRPANERSASNLFADEDAGGDSPWAMPTPKKAGRAQLVKTLLKGSEVPESYIDAFDKLSTAGDGVDIDAVNNLLVESGLGNDTRQRILGVVFPNGLSDSIGRGEFSVFLALVGLALEGEDVTLDSVDERRRSRFMESDYCSTVETNSV
jgi:sorting nexin-8